MDDLAPLYWALLASLVLVALILGYIEYQVYLLRTDVKGTPGGLRFSAHDFSVEVRRADKTMQVDCKNGQLTTQTVGGTEEPVVRSGRLSATLPVAGLRVKVARLAMRRHPDDTPVPTGYSSIVWTASTEMTLRAQGKPGGQRQTLQLDRVPDTVADAFKRFSSGNDEWMDLLERNLVSQIIDREAQEAAAAAPAEAVKPVKTSLTPAEQEAKAKLQLEQWRQSAGFAGVTTEMRFDQDGVIDWLLDLSADGRIILHAGERHFHGSLKGAVVSMLADELELMVRDDYWQEGDTHMPTFRLLKGAPIDTVNTWRKRLGDAIQKLRDDPDRKPVV